MNIFDIYLDKIKKLAIKLNKKNVIEIPESLNGINVDVPPPQFDCDISTNVAMVLSKLNKKSPIDLANQLSELIKKDDKNIYSINVAKPGFINIKFEGSFWNNFLKEIIDNHKTFGVNKKQKKHKYLVEFVSANPTGPLHVGHCRGAVIGDVISNILSFNQHKVTKEYYVNDHGNQIISFTKSVYLRIREILNNEKFPTDDPDLYPGDYLIDIAKNIISENKKFKFDNFDNISRELTKLSVDQSLKMIKLNLNSLGINHDNFASETEIVNNNEVQLVVDKLKKGNFVYQGKIKAPKGEDKNDWIERDQLLFKSTDFGDDKEDYRWQFLIKNQRSRDDYDAIIAMAKAFELSGTDLDEAIEQTIDVDSWMRNVAFQSLIENRDVYSRGLKHNVMFYVRPSDQKVMALPIDMDHIMRNSDAMLHGYGNLGKIVDRPATWQRWSEIPAS